MKKLIVLTSAALLCASFQASAAPRLQRAGNSSDAGISVLTGPLLRPLLRPLGPLVGGLTSGIGNRATGLTVTGLGSLTDGLGLTSLPGALLTPVLVPVLIPVIARLDPARAPAASSTSGGQPERRLALRRR